MGSDNLTIMEFYIGEKPMVTADKFAWGERVGKEHGFFYHGGQRETMEKSGNGAYIDLAG